MEAAHAEISNNVVFASMPCNLTNLLVDTSTAMSLNEGSCAPSRFDFCTDPMAAFSADMKRNNAGNQFPHIISLLQLIIVLPS